MSPSSGPKKLASRPLKGSADCVVIVIGFGGKESKDKVLPDEKLVVSTDCMLESTRSDGMLN